MNTDNNPQSDILDAVGQLILRLDTRWLIIVAVAFVSVFTIILRLWKQRWPTREEALTLGLTFLQLYSAPVLFSMLVLTQPPAVELVSNFQRQSAGLLAFIFLVAGVFVQIKKLWDLELTADHQSRSDSPDPAPKSVPKAVREHR